MPDKKVKLKICGMREASNIIEVAVTQPDYIGFIFYKESKRWVGHDFRIPNGLPEKIKRVGVFVNEAVEMVEAQTDIHWFDNVQLHGDETPEYCSQLKDLGIHVIKAFSVDENFDFNMTKAYQPYVDYFLFDTKGQGYGGTGKSFDWSLLKKYNQEVPFFLSGGLSAKNMEYALQLNDVNLYGLDVNSGVEIQPGLKDITKINQVQSILTFN
jgi:phosphoribosylanthranilate isomerase